MDKLDIRSGLSCVVMNYYKKLDSSRITFDFMLNEEPDAEIRKNIESNGSRIYVMPALKVRNTFRYIKALRDFYAAHDYKIIHGHVANSAVFYLGLAKSGSVRIIHSQNAGGSAVLLKRIRNRVLTFFIRFVANRFIACSKEAAEYLFGKKDGVLILNNAIEVERFVFDSRKREETRSALNLQDKKVIGHVGRFCAEKNHSFLIDVFEEIYLKDSSFALLLVGSGELFAEIERKVSVSAASGNITLAGSPESVNEYLCAMDIFAMPSVSEGVPLTAVEAQACGLPVLLSDRISVETNVSGRCVFLSLEADWADELMKTEAVDRVHAGEAVRDSDYNVEKQVDKLCRYYESVI